MVRAGVLWGVGRAGGGSQGDVSRGQPPGCGAAGGKFYTRMHDKSVHACAMKVLHTRAMTHADCSWCHRSSRGRL